MRFSEKISKIPNQTSKTKCFHIEVAAKFPFSVGKIAEKVVSIGVYF